MELVCTGLFGTVQGPKQTASSGLSQLLSHQCRRPDVGLGGYSIRSHQTQRETTPPPYFAFLAQYHGGPVSPCVCAGPLQLHKDRHEGHHIAMYTERVKQCPYIGSIGYTTLHYGLSHQATYPPPHAQLPHHSLQSTGRF